MSLLEQARALHEDIEIIERAVYTELGDPSATKLKRVEEIARDQAAAAAIRVVGALQLYCTSAPLRVYSAYSPILRWLRP